MPGVKMFKVFKNTKLLKNPTILAASVLIWGLSAFSARVKADGFVCENLEESLKVQVYNHTKPTRGTRSPAVMVVSDPGRELGKKTIAVFRSADGELFADGSRFYAFSADASEAELPQWDAIRQAISGIEELEILEVSLAVDFKYSQPVPHGSPLEGVLELVLESGDLLWLEMDCVRYLKSAAGE